MKSRYEFLKRLYPKSIVIFETKGSYHLYGKERILLSLVKSNLIAFLKANHVDYIVVDNLEIQEKHEFPNNKYDAILWKMVLVELLRNQPHSS